MHDTITKENRSIAKTNDFKISIKDDLRVA